MVLCDKFLKVSNALTLQQSFWKTKFFFEKLVDGFSVKTAKIENASFLHKTASSKANVKTYSIGSTKWTQNGVLPVTSFKSSPPEVFLGKGVLKICSGFTGEHRSLELGFSPVNLRHIFRTSFPRILLMGCFCTLFFWKFYFSVKTSYQELIWCTNYPNAHIPTFCKCWSFIWECFFPMSILKNKESNLSKNC